MTGAKENTDGLGKKKKSLKTKSRIVNDLDKIHISALSTVVQFECINCFVHVFSLNVKSVPGRTVVSSSLNLMTSASLKGLPQKI